MNNNIKYNNKKVRKPEKCSMIKVGNKLTELCNKEKSCRYVNDIMECPGFDMDIPYGYIDDIGEDISGTIDIIENNNNNNDTIKIINEPFTNFMSTKINNMSYNSVSEDIQKRYQRLSGEQLSEEQSNMPNLKQEHPVFKVLQIPITPIVQEENKIIKNQEESASTINMSETKSETRSEVEHEIGNKVPSESITIQESTQKPSLIMQFWNQYKFWIIVTFILLVFLFIGILFYMCREKKPLIAIETVNVQTPSPTNMMGESEFKNLIFKQNKPEANLSSTVSEIPIKSTSELKLNADTPSPTNVSEMDLKKILVPQSAQSAQNVPNK